MPVGFEEGPSHANGWVCGILLFWVHEERGVGGVVDTVDDGDVYRYHWVAMFKSSAAFLEKSIGILKKD